MLEKGVIVDHACFMCGCYADWLRLPGCASLMKCLMSSTMPMESSPLSACISFKR